MQALLEVVLPVFLVLGAGYLAAWRGLLSEAVVDALMVFTQRFAIPCLLFGAIAGMDLSATFDLALLASFYVGASAGFAAGLLGARFLFRRPWPDAVAIGFCTLFSNSVLLGLPITERAYGADALGPNFAIIAFHAPFCYVVGIAAMEIVRSTGNGIGRAILGATLQNALVIGILLGFAVNISGLPVPEVLDDAVSMLARAALPAALFGLGGILYRYRPEGDALTIAWVCGVSLVLHPAVVWLMGTATGLEPGAFRSAVLTAAMAPGVNTYIFANMYGVARRVAASSVLVATALSVLTIWLWLAVLP